MARKYFPHEDPLGQRLVMRQIVPGATGQFGPDVSWEIVGVIADERFTPFSDGTERPAMYVSYAQSPTPFQLLVVRSTGRCDVDARAGPQGGCRRSIVTRRSPTS